MTKLLVSFLTPFFLLFPTVFPSHAQETGCSEYRRYPLAGHPVEIVELHPSDGSYQFLKELSDLKLILLEPGICKAALNGEDWFKGRVFVFKSRSANFTHGDIIAINAGRFR